MIFFHATVEPVIEASRDALVAVGALLETTPEAHIEEVVAEMDLRLRGVYGQLEATRRLLTLYRRPRPAPYDPAEVIRSAAAQVAAVAAEPGGLRAIRRCEGDAEQVVECVRVLTGSLLLETGGTIRTTVLPGDCEPRVVVEGALLPERLSIDGVYSVLWEDWEQCWAAATGGGASLRERDRVHLFLEGAGDGGVDFPALEAPLEALKGSVQGLRSWRGAIGHYEPGYASAAEIVQLYRKTVDRVLRDLEGLSATLP